MNSGTKLEDYIIVDPFYSFDFPRTMYDFYRKDEEKINYEGNYPYPCKQMGSERYEIRTFNSQEDIKNALGL